MIQKKDKRLHVRRNDKDDASHLSDEDTDPRQYERAEEQATRSARVLYMIERQVNYHSFCLIIPLGIVQQMVVNLQLSE